MPLVRRRWGRLLLVLAVLLVLAGVVGVLTGSRFVWGGRLFDHVFLFGVLAAVAAAVGLLLLVSRRWLGVLLAVASLVVAAGWGLIGLLDWAIFGEDEVVTVAAPDGAGQRFEVTVTLAADVIDPIWRVSVRQTRFPLARQWEVGCLDGDDPANEFDGVQWRNRGELVVTTAGGADTIVVNPTSGKPHQGRGGIWDDC